MKKWHKLYRLQEDFVCRYCAAPIVPGQESRDHRIPLSRHGPNTPENIDIVCKYHNQQKGSLTDEEYEIWRRLEFIRNGGLNNKGRTK